MNKLLIAPALAAALAILAGCSPATVDGSGGGQSVGAGGGTASNLATSFNSCTSLTTADIVSYGLNPETKTDQSHVLEGRQVGCSWQNQQSTVGFIYQNVPANAFTTNPSLHGVTQIEIRGRNAYLAPDPATGACAIAIQVGPDSAVVGVNLKYATFAAGGVDPCALNKTIAQKFETKLPK